MNVLLHPNLSNFLELLILIMALCVCKDFSSCHEIYLRNPSIRPYKILPTHGADITRVTRFKTGFGYDSSSDDYKIFRVVHESYF